MSAPLDKIKKITDPRIRHCIVCGNDYHPSKSAPSMYCSLCDAVMASLKKQDADLQRSRAQLDAEYEGLIEPNEKLKSMFIEPGVDARAYEHLDMDSELALRADAKYEAKKSECLQDVGLKIFNEAFNEPQTKCCGGCKKPPVKPLFKGNNAPVGLIPSIMLFEMGRAMKDGAEKHGGAFNWRSGETQKLMYHCNAAIGHILQFVDGENVASDSGISHLAHASAQLAIALDKVKCRLDVDDRVKVSNLDV